jgi:hypothetical protein
MANVSGNRASVILFIRLRIGVIFRIPIKPNTITRNIEILPKITLIDTMDRQIARTKTGPEIGKFKVIKSIYEYAQSSYGCSAELGAKFPYRLTNDVGG